MTSQSRDFMRDDDGAVTVDFVVLTGMVIGLCLLFIVPVLEASVGWGESLAGLVDEQLGD